MADEKNKPGSNPSLRFAGAPQGIEGQPGSESGGAPFELASEYLDLSRRQRNRKPPLSGAETLRWRWLRAELETVLSKGSTELAPDPKVVERNFLRVPTLRQIEFTDGERRVCGFLTQVGEGGVFIATELPFERGTEIKLEIGRRAADGSEELVVVAGVVRWTRFRQHGGLPAGMGLAFDELDEQQYGGVVGLIEEALFMTLSHGDR